MHRSQNLLTTAVQETCVLEIQIRPKYMIVRAIESYVPMPRHATRWYVSTNQVLAEVVLQSHQIVSLSRVGKTVQNPKLADYLK